MTRQPVKYRSYTSTWFALRNDAPSKPHRPTRCAVARLDLNTVNQQNLECLAMLNAELAEALIAARPFRSWEDVGRVKGFYLALIEDLVMGGIVLNSPSTRDAQL